MHNSAGPTVMLSQQGHFTHCPLFESILNDFQDIGAGCYSQFYDATAHCLHVPFKSSPLETLYPSA